MNKVAAIIIVLLLAVIGALSYILTMQPSAVPIETPTSTPATTTGQVGGDGHGHVIDPNAPLNERVFVDSPSPGQSVGKTFTVTGEAPGNWYFEASFPIQVRDKDGNVIARSYGMAQTEWMTTDQVEFIGNVTIDSDYKGIATLIIMKDNPSGLPEHDDSTEFEIVIQ